MTAPYETALNAQRRAWASAAEFVDRLAATPDAAAAAASVEVGETPSEVVYEENKLRLLHYEPLTDERHDVPILIVYALINRPYILDLQPDRSVVRTLLEEGFDVYLIDWGEPSTLDTSLTLSDYVDRYVDNCVDVVRERSGRDAINVLGYCMGGTMSAMYAALYPEKVRNLGLMAAGLCFDDTGGVLELWGEEEFYDPEAVTETFGNVPSEFLDAGFAMMDPVENYVTKYVRFFENVEDEDFVENFARMERWLSDGIDVAGEAYVEFLRDVYQDNRLYRNELELDGRHVDLAAVDMPVLQIVAEYDHLIPPAASKPFNDVVGSEDTEILEFPTGHIGMSVSSRSHAELWPDVCEWFAERSVVEADETGPAETVAGDLQTGGEEVQLTTGAPTEAADGETTAADGRAAGGDEPVDAAEGGDDTPPAREGGDLTDLDGIGEAYAADLRDAGVGSVAELAAADAPTLAERSGVGETRLEGWIEQARDRLEASGEFEAAGE